LKLKFRNSESRVIINYLHLTALYPIFNIYLKNFIQTKLLNIDESY